MFEVVLLIAATAAAVYVLSHHGPTVLAQAVIAMTMMWAIFFRSHKP